VFPSNGRSPTQHTIATALSSQHAFRHVRTLHSTLSARYDIFSLRAHATEGSKIDLLVNFLLFCVCVYSEDGARVNEQGLQ
jgi:DNA-binding transcriptional MocR family regulator